ncbi:MAG: DnaJ domain-containing protein [Gammaproteobacteria bacterium]|nr:DnaJ domain-containing protein [Gammaproteobacteria bacterium]
MGTNTSSAQQLFLQQLLEVLRAHPAGISEYELIRALDSAGESRFGTNCLRNNLSLFQTHFFLFHSLYQLHEQLRHSNRAHLEIGPLCIQLLPGNDNSWPALSTHNPLRDYYLNIDNLNNTDADDVELLLGEFWERFVRNDNRDNALAELELNDPVDWTTIKTQHRRLAMQHHPDRGGDEQRLQAINAAMNVLARNERHQ